jgi:hypothetical protein
MNDKTIKRVYAVQIFSLVLCNIIKFLSCNEKTLNVKEITADIKYCDDSRKYNFFFLLKSLRSEADLEFTYFYTRESCIVWMKYFSELFLDVGVIVFMRYLQLKRRQSSHSFLIRFKDNWILKIFVIPIKIISSMMT